jgi:hypothetical protein
MQTTGDARSAPGCLHQAGERKGYNMTMKERIKVHVQIERENRRKVEKWKKGGNAA